MENLTLLTSQLLDTCSQSMPTSANGLWLEHVEIRKIVDEIRQLQKETEKTADRLAELPNFLTWCDKAGIKRTDGLEIKPVSGGRGLGVICNNTTFEVGQLLVEVPSKAMMTLENAKKSDLRRAFSLDPILQKMENVGLSIFLINEKLKSTESFWYYYIKLLPAEFSTPMYFESDELQLLKGSLYFEEALKLWRNITRQYAYFYQLIANDNSIFRDSRFNLHNFTFDLYRWATAVVMTRLNLVLDQNTANKSNPVLIPFWDMANHDPSLPMCTDFDDDHLCSKMYAGKRYEPGDEICIFYGPRSNGEFFLHNGFVVDDESRDCVAVRLGLTKNDPLFSLKESVLAKLAMMTSHTFNLRKNDSDGLNKLLLYAVVFNANENQIRSMTSITTVNFDDYLNLDNDLLEKSRNFLKIRLQLLTKSYVVVDDQAKQSMSENAKLVLNFIQKEKNILQHTIEQF